MIGRRRPGFDRPLLARKLPVGSRFIIENSGDPLKPTHHPANTLQEIEGLEDWLWFRGVRNRHVIFEITRGGGQTDTGEFVIPRQHNPG